MFALLVARQTEGQRRVCPLGYVERLVAAWLCGRIRQDMLLRACPVRSQHIHACCSVVAALLQRASLTRQSLQGENEFAPVLFAMKMAVLEIMSSSMSATITSTLNKRDPAGTDPAASPQCERVQGMQVMQEEMTQLSQRVEAACRTLSHGLAAARERAEDSSKHTASLVQTVAALAEQVTNMSAELQVACLSPGLVTCLERMCL